MGMADKITENFEPHRRSSETVVAAFPATTHHQGLAMLPAACAGVGAVMFDRYATSLFWVIVPLLSLIPVVWFVFVNRNYTIIATNERTVVARSSTFSVLRVESITGELSRDVQIGPTSGLMHRTNALGEPMRIHRRAFDQVRRADTR
jgi:hypothetical protein